MDLGMDIDVVVRYAGDSEWRSDNGDWAVAWIAFSASTGRGVKICWKQADFRDASAFGFMAATVALLEG
jgi:hypothetical protein